MANEMNTERAQNTSQEVADLYLSLCALRLGRCACLEKIGFAPRVGGAIGLDMSKLARADEGMSGGQAWKERVA